jgi:nitroreductase
MDDKIEYFYSILKSRYSVRNYLKDEVPDTVIERILEVGREAASAANRQPWAFVICKGKDKKPLNEVFYKDGFQDAPVVIAALAKPAEAWIRRQDNRNYAYVDVAIAVTEMILAATAEGLGTCWIAAFDCEEAMKILEVPDDMEIVTLVTLGYPLPGEKQPKRIRKPEKDTIFKGKYRRK